MLEKNYIELENIRIFAHHGCLDEEGIIGSDYRVDLLLSTSFAETQTTDSIEHTIDYVSLNAIVKQEMAKRSKLLEHVAYRIIDCIESQFPIESIRVRIAKLNPPIEGDVASVAILIEKNCNTSRQI